MSFINFYSEKIIQSELSFLFLSLFDGSQPIRIQHFLKVNCLLFLENLNSKTVYQKTFEFPRVIFQEKRKNSNWFSY